MISRASARPMLSRWASPKADMPYIRPKLIILARRRISALTSVSGTPNTRAEVAAWMSTSPANASTSPGSSVIAAMIRSSIWE